MARRPSITPAHRTKFLAALAAGKPRGVAAREAHKDLTGTAFRGVENRDPKFAAKVAAAEAEGRLERGDRIATEFERRAFDPDKPSLRALEILAATHHPDYAWLRRRGSTGTDGSQGGLQSVVDPDLLTARQMGQLIELVKMGQGLIPNPELDSERERRALPSGDVIDQDEAA